MERKLRTTVAQLLSRPSLLAYTIYQGLSFDNALREAGFGLSGTLAQPSGAEDVEWKGTSDTILGNVEWFNAWLEGERKCEFIGTELLLNLY